MLIDLFPHAHPQRWEALEHAVELIEKQRKPYTVDDLLDQLGAEWSDGPSRYRVRMPAFRGTGGTSRTFNAHHALHEAAERLHQLGLIQRLNERKPGVSAVYLTPSGPKEG